MIHVETIVNETPEIVWQKWNSPADINVWSHASDDWETRDSVNDLREGGAFSSTMAARDGSASFEFGGTYARVIEPELIEYVMDDGRKVVITFTSENGATKISQDFDPEDENPEDVQREGWQSILNNFKKYVEGE